jgi:hypothetical protein
MLYLVLLSIVFFIIIYRIGLGTESNGINYGSLENINITDCHLVIALFSRCLIVVFLLLYEEPLGISLPVS